VITAAVKSAGSELLSRDGAIPHERNGDQAHRNQDQDHAEQDPLPECEIAGPGRSGL
jgi:hypothetical protein